MATTKDIDGNVVREGSVVCVLSIGPSVTADLSGDERSEVLSMKNAQLEVYEIDEYGAAWVKKWWRQGDDKAYSHSVGLKPSEMRLVR